MGHPEIHWKGFFLGGNIRKPMIFKQEVIELIFSNSQDTHTHIDLGLLPHPEAVITRIIIF